MLYMHVSDMFPVSQKMAHHIKNVVQIIVIIDSYAAFPERCMSSWKT